MGFNVDIPNARGARPGYGGALPGPLARGGGPAAPNQAQPGDRKNEESGKTPSVGGFVTPPNEHAPMPGYGGKM